MLNPVEASERLALFETPDINSARAARASVLPPPIRTLAYALLNRNAAGETDKSMAPLRPDYTYDIGNFAYTIQEGIGLLNSSSDSERLNLFKTLYPGLADSINAAWNLCADLPYSSTSGSILRAPGQKNLAAGRRQKFLVSLSAALERYDPDVVWLARWAPYLSTRYDLINPHQAKISIGLLLATTIDAGGSKGEEVLQILKDSIDGKDPVGAMGLHVLTGLLTCSREVAWETVKNLFVVSHRDEGLRAMILECAGDGHVGALRLFAQLAVSPQFRHLTSVRRTAAVWLMLPELYVKEEQDTVVLEEFVQFLGDPEGAARAVTSGSARTMYSALLAGNVADALSLRDKCNRLLLDPNADRRITAAYLLDGVGLKLPWQPPAPAANTPITTSITNAIAGLFGKLRNVETAQSEVTSPVPPLITLMDDPDIAVASYACMIALSMLQAPTEFDWCTPLAKLIARLPSDTLEIKELSWLRFEFSLTRDRVCSELVSRLGMQNIETVTSILPLMDSWNACRFIQGLSRLTTWREETRRAVLDLTSSRASSVRDAAMEILEKRGILPEEAATVEHLLSRKGHNSRISATRALLSLTDDQVAQSVERLLKAKAEQSRLAGLQLLEQVIAAGRMPQQARTIAADWASSARVSMLEKPVLDRVLNDAVHEVFDEITLGLYSPSDLTVPIVPKMCVGALGTDAAERCLESLLIFVDTNAQTMVDIVGPTEPITLPFSSAVNRIFRSSIGNFEEGGPEQYSIEGALNAWYDDRPDSQRDNDGLELVRVLALLGLSDQGMFLNPESEQVRALKSLLYHSGCIAAGKLHNAFSVRAVATFLIVRNNLNVHAMIDLVLDGIETRACVWNNAAEHLTDKPDLAMARLALLDWSVVAEFLWRVYRSSWQQSQIDRYWRLIRSRPTFKWNLSSLEVQVLLHSVRSGAASEADLVASIIGSGIWLSRRVPREVIAANPDVEPILDRISQRIVDVEIKRGDMPTCVTRVASRMTYAGGLSVLGRLLEAMQGADFTYGAYEEARTAVLSHLIRVTEPEPDASVAQFSDVCNRLKLSDSRLLDLAMMAPQWATMVERHLGWASLAEGVMWAHMHTSNTYYNPNIDGMPQWKAAIMERTPLLAQEMADGVCDVNWFLSLYPDLGPDRWRKLYASAKKSAPFGGHKRAQLYADAMTGAITESQIQDQVITKRHQDSVRAYGLLPVPTGEAGEEAVILRYQFLQGFLRESKQFGAQRRESEGLAVQIGLRHLAQVAGYEDPMRLEWAVETASVRDLTLGPVTVEVDGVTVSLSIDPLGKAVLTVVKSGKSLAAIPAAVKKNAAIDGLVVRSKALGQQMTRMRNSLQDAMCRGVAFRASEIRSMMKHPVLAPMLRSLVFVTADAAGYPIEDGSKLLSWDNTHRSVPDGALLLLAHPYDLLRTGYWPEWQRDCFLAERVQPFKQVFRELYVRTESEIEGGTCSDRYAGHQLDARKAGGVLKSRGWIEVHEEGIRKTFHRDRITAWIDLNLYWGTVSDIEPPEIESVRFTRIGENMDIALVDIPPRLFSEVMRDLDLVVSTACASGMDPEATASTLEMRGQLVMEAARLLKLPNVTVHDRYVQLQGSLSRYTIHLGSGIVHRQPGGHLCIVPVSAQQRGRVFLPFADDDPRSAEIISKVILLANDKDIKDPMILEQILPDRL